MGIPLDINKLKKSALSVTDASNRHIDIDIYVDKTASQQLYSFIIKLFSTDSDKVDIHVFDITQKSAIMQRSCDLAVVVCGQTSHGLLTYLSNCKYQNTVCMVTIEPQNILSDFKAIGVSPIKTDIICPSIGLYKKLDYVDDVVDFTYITDLMAKDIADKLGRFISNECFESRLVFARNFEFCQPSVVNSIIQRTSIENAAIGVVPFMPGGDMPIMTVNQAKMLMQIASIYGFDVTADRIVELAVLAISAFALRKVCRGLKQTTNISGFVLNGAFGYLGTSLLGRLSVGYFQSGGQLENLADTITDFFSSIDFPEFISSFINDFKIPDIDFGDFKIPEILLPNFLRALIK